MRYTLPIIFHRLADVQAVFCTFGLIADGPANLFLVLIAEFPPLSFIFIHIFILVIRRYNACLIINMASVEKVRGVVEINFCD